MTLADPGSWRMATAARWTSGPKSAGSASSPAPAPPPPGGSSTDERPTQPHARPAVAMVRAAPRPGGKLGRRRAGIRLHQVHAGPQARRRPSLPALLVPRIRPAPLLCGWRSLHVRRRGLRAREGHPHPLVAPDNEGRPAPAVLYLAGRERAVEEPISPARQ